MPYNPARVKEIEDSYGPESGRHYWNLQCGLCGYCVNGLCPDEAIRLLTQHEKDHPEWKEYRECLPNKGENDAKNR